MALPDEELSPVDFKAIKRNWIQYSRPNSIHLPLRTVNDFEWKDYCPAVFRHILELANFEYADYMLSVCADETLREVSSPRKCGKVFFLSKENRFIIKTLRKSEVKVILKMLPNYYCHLKKYKASLLSKMFGLHAVRPAGGIKVYFVVMSDVMLSDMQINKFYDLKGSSKGRTLNKVVVDEATIYKDLDLDYCFYLNPSVRIWLLKQIKHDCEFLEAEGIMDYSFLIGIHIKASRQGSLDGRNSSTKKKISNDTIQGYEDPELNLSDVCKQPERPGLRFGAKIPACAVCTPTNETGSASSNRRVRAEECHHVFLHIGIVDIFQNYNVIKRIEHAYKSIIQYDSTLVSTVNPKLYSSRLHRFLSKLFLPEDSD